MFLTYSLKLESKFPLKHVYNCFLFAYHEHPSVWCLLVGEVMSFIELTSVCERDTFFELYRTDLKKSFWASQRLSLFIFSLSNLGTNTATVALKNTAIRWKYAEYQMLSNVDIEEYNENSRGQILLSFPLWSASQGRIWSIVKSLLMNFNLGPEAVVVWVDESFAISFNNTQGYDRKDDRIVNALLWPFHISAAGHGEGIWGCLDLGNGCQELGNGWNLCFILNALASTPKLACWGSS